MHIVRSQIFEFLICDFRVPISVFPANVLLISVFGILASDVRYADASFLISDLPTSDFMCARGLRGESNTAALGYGVVALLRECSGRDDSHWMAWPPVLQGNSECNRRTAAMLGDARVPPWPPGKQLHFKARRHCRGGSRELHKKREEV